jgi:uncharacterized membrane protein YeaQ/YmgE (transglycosylase-associated protein family)
MAAVREYLVTGLLWIVIIGFIAGVIACFLLPGPNNPQRFLLTIVLGIAGAFVSTWISQSIGWYRPDRARGSSVPRWCSDFAYCLASLGCSAPDQRSRDFPHHLAALASIASHQEPIWDLSMC